MTDHDSDIRDARSHVGHADVVLAICAYPPEGDGPALIGATCSVNPIVPGYVLEEAADTMADYAAELRKLGRARTATVN